MIKKRIDKLRNQFIRYNIDGYVIPKNDEFFSEYSNKDRLKIISNLKQKTKQFSQLLFKVACRLISYQQN